MFVYVITIMCAWQVTQLKRELLRSRDAAYNELQMRNKFLSERLEELETHLRQRGKSDTSVASMVRLLHCALSF